MGPSLLGFPTARLVPLGGGASGGETGDRRPVASCRISPLLALAFSAEGVGEAEDGFRDSSTDRADRERKSRVGSYSRLRLLERHSMSDFDWVSHHCAITAVGQRTPA